MRERWTEADVAALLARRRGPQDASVDSPAETETPKKSKYKNVKTWVGDACFDSKREAEHWIQLKAREALGEISELERQYRFDLKCPAHNRPGMDQAVSAYVADFVYFDADMKLHVVDAKGHRTREYSLKKKWLELQDGIIIEEV